MAKARKIFLLRERRETLRLRLEKNQRAMCELCGQVTEWLNTTAAADEAEVTEREIFRMVERGEVHFLELKAGSLLICRRSVNKAKAKSEEVK